MTHPFHPLSGRGFQLADYRSAWGEDRVYVYGDGGQLLRLPAAWTDYAEPDPFVVAAGGGSVLHAAELVRLVELVDRVTETECKGNHADNVKIMMAKERAAGETGELS